MSNAGSVRQFGAVAAAYSLAITPFNIAPLLVSAVITVVGANEQQSGQLLTLDLVRETQAVQKLRKLTLNLDQLMQAGQDDQTAQPGVADERREAGIGVLT